MQSVVPMETSNLVSAIPKSLKITICGGGNGAHTAAVYLGSKPGLSVRVLTRQPERWSRQLLLKTNGTSWEEKGDIHGVLETVSKDPKEVIPSADIVIVAAPAHAHGPILSLIAPHVAPQTILGTLYSQGGFDWLVRATFQDSSRLDAVFGLQNIPWICKATEYGKQAALIGPKKHLVLACSPQEKTNVVSCLIASLFDIPCKTVPHFLALTLTPSNQIIHPARYYGMFHNWDGKSPIPKDQIQWGLYAEMDDLSAETLEGLDAELQSIVWAIARRYPTLNLSSVIPIKERILDQYGSDVQDPTSLKTVFRTNKGYAGCRTPVEPCSSPQETYRPALTSRLFWEDIPYGLCLLKSFAEMLELSTPYIDKMILWHQQFMDKEFLDPSTLRLNPKTLSDTGVPQVYGLKTLEDIVSFTLNPLSMC